RAGIEDLQRRSNVGGIVAAPRGGCGDRAVRLEAQDLPPVRALQEELGPRNALVGGSHGRSSQQQRCDDEGDRSRGAVHRGFLLPFWVLVPTPRFSRQ